MLELTTKCLFRTVVLITTSDVLILYILIEESGETTVFKRFKNRTSTFYFPGPQFPMFETRGLDSCRVF